MAPTTVAALRQTASDRVTVLLTSGEEIKTTLNVVTDLRLYAGRELDEEELAGLRAAASSARTRARALDLLSRGTTPPGATVPGASGRSCSAAGSTARSGTRPWARRAPPMTGSTNSSPRD